MEQTESDYIKFKDIAKKLGMSRQSVTRKFQVLPGAKNVGTEARAYWLLPVKSWKEWQAAQPQTPSTSPSRRPKAAGGR
jgi:predicted DNA-binding transcriptional regulator AlpA